MKISENNRKTILQFARFTLIGTLTTGLHIIILAWLYGRMRGWTAPLPGPLAFFYNESTVGPGHENWGYLMPFLIATVISNTISYLFNKHANFRSDAPLSHFFLYLLVLTAITLLCTWLQGIIFNLLLDAGQDALAPVVSSLAAAVIQGLILFPIHKFILLKEKVS